MSTSDDSTRPISVAELLARNGTIGSPPVTGHRRRRRSGGISVAELTGEIPIIRPAETPPGPKAEANEAEPEVQPEGQADAEVVTVEEADSESAVEAASEDLSASEPSEELVEEVTVEEDAAGEAGEDVLVDEAPAVQVLVEEASVEDGEALVEEGFHQEAGVEEAAVAQVAVEEVAVEEAAFEEAAVEGIAEEAAVEELGDEVLVEDGAVEEVHAEEAVVEETAVEETAVEEAPDGELAAEAVVEETVVEGAPVEELAEEDFVDEITQEPAAEEAFAEEISLEEDLAEEILVEEALAEEAALASLAEGVEVGAPEGDADVEQPELSETLDVPEEPAVENPPQRRRSKPPKSRNPLPRRVRGLQRSHDPRPQRRSGTEARRPEPARPSGAEQMNYDPVDGAVSLPELVSDQRDGVEELRAYLQSSGGTLFSGETVADDLARRRAGPSGEVTDAIPAQTVGKAKGGKAKGQDGAPKPRESRWTSLRHAVVAVLQSMLAVVFGGGLFVAFDQLWRWNNIVALVLSVLVILGLVVAVRVVRKTEDIASTLIAVAVGALVTLGPLALLQST